MTEAFSYPFMQRALVTGLVVWRRLAAAPGDGKAPEMPPIPDVEPVPTATA